MSTALVPFVVVVDGQAFPLERNAAGEVLIEDLELARKTGYAKPYNIRKLEARYSDDLGHLFSLVENKSSPTRGRPIERRYLNEWQACFLIAKSETPQATAHLKQIINVFVLARRGYLVEAQQAAHASAPGELASLRERMDRVEGTMAKLVDAHRANFALLQDLTKSSNLLPAPATPPTELRTPISAPPRPTRANDPRQLDLLPVPTKQAAAALGVADSTLCHWAQKHPDIGVECIANWGGAKRKRQYMWRLPKTRLVLIQKGLIQAQVG